jgi:hypothetical protein
MASSLPAPPPTSTTPGPVAQHERDTSVFGPRSRKQLLLFGAGAAFFGYSSLMTRRSLVRRYKSTIPKFYTPSTKPPEVNGALEAVDALTIATANVASVMMMTAGGLAWAFDISGLEDLRGKMRSALDLDGVASEADMELEEWIAEVLDRKVKREGRGEGKGEGKDGKK